VLHAFSTRRGGVSQAPSPGLNLGFTQWDLRARVEQNRRQFFQGLGAAHFTLASLRQVHSGHAYQVARSGSGELEYHPSGFTLPTPRSGRLPAGDALLTSEAGILLAVRSADCLPLLLADPCRPVVAAVHMGWRGALAGLAEKTVREMRRAFGSEPARVLAALGPSIRACCYEVGQEVVHAFMERFAGAERFFRKGDHPSPEATERSHVTSLAAALPGHSGGAAEAVHLDLVAVACAQLRSAGLLPRHIHVAEFCTACRTDLFFSHRREGTRTGRTMALIGIRPEAECQLR
jgi:YfiH family protein